LTGFHPYTSNSSSASSCYQLLALLAHELSDQRQSSVIFPAMPAPATAQVPASSKSPAQKPTPDRKYKCTFCARAFSRSEHRSRHERSRKCLRTLHCVSRWRGCSHGGVVEKLLCPLLLIHLHITQTPKSDPSNVRSAEAPLFDETSCYDTIAPCTPKMEASRSSAKSRDGRAQKLPRRQPHRSRQSPWIQRRWNK